MMTRFFSYSVRFRWRSCKHPDGLGVSANRRCRASGSSARSCPTGGRRSESTIQFEDATDKAGIDFTHSFGSRQLGSLLEGTGAGCVWFDYNNSGLHSLYVVNGRPLDDSMHPYPLKEKPAIPAAQSSLSQRRQRPLYRCDRTSRA